MIFDGALQIKQTFVPELVEVVDPVGDRFQTEWFEVVDAFPAACLNGDELAFFEYGEVFFYRSAGY